MSCYLGYKIWGSTDGETLKWDYGGSTGGCTCTLITLRGQNRQSPIDTTYVRATHFNDGTVNTPNEAGSAILTVKENAWVLLLQLMTQGISGAAGPPLGYTELADHLTSATTSRGSYVCRKAIASPATETPGVFTHTDETGTSENRTFSISIRPASSMVLFRRRRG